MKKTILILTVVFTAMISCKKDKNTLQFNENEQVMLKVDAIHKDGSVITSDIVLVRLK